MSLSTEVALALLGALAVSVAASPVVVSSAVWEEPLVQQESDARDHLLSNGAHRLASAPSAPPVRSRGLREVTRTIEEAERTLHQVGHDLYERRTAPPRPDPPRPITVWFRFDSAYVDEAARLRLSAFASRLPAGTEVTVAGHADHTGPESYNVGLSWRRADAVTKLLAAQGLNPTPEAYGERCPATRSRGGTERSRRWDRRVVVSLGRAVEVGQGEDRPCPP